MQPQEHAKPNRLTVTQTLKTSKGYLTLGCILICRTEITVSDLAIGELLKGLLMSLSLSLSLLETGLFVSSLLSYSIWWVSCWWGGCDHQAHHQDQESSSLINQESSSDRHCQLCRSNSTLYQHTNSNRWFDWGEADVLNSCNKFRSILWDSNDLFV